MLKHHAQATCCSDHIHCCPANTICDLEHGVCKAGEKHVPLLKKIQAVPNDGKNKKWLHGGDLTTGQMTDEDSLCVLCLLVLTVECPDQKSACPDQTTCCHLTNDSYGCCPMPDVSKQNLHICSNQTCKTQFSQSSVLVIHDCVATGTNH